MKSVSVIIPNRNHANHLQKCLEALLHSSVKAQIILVDDASTDDSLKIAQKFPAKVIANKQNLGPTKSRNLGAKMASGEFVLFLDADMAVSKNYIGDLANYLDSHSDIGIVTGKIISSRGERVNWTFGYDFSVIRDQLRNIFESLVSIFPFLKRFAKPFTLNYIKDSETEVDWVRESAFMINKKLFEKLAGFDEGYFMYAEGPDLCRRVRLAGFKVCYYPKALVQDLGGHTHKSIMNRVMLRSTLRYYKKYPKLF